MVIHCFKHETRLSIQDYYVSIYVFYHIKHIIAIRKRKLSGQSITLSAFPFECATSYHASKIPSKIQLPRLCSSTSITRNLFTGHGNLFSAQFCLPPCSTWSEIFRPWYEEFFAPFLRTLIAIMQTLSQDFFGRCNTLTKSQRPKKPSDCVCIVAPPQYFISFAVPRFLGPLFYTLQR